MPPLLAAVSLRSYGSTVVQRPRDPNDDKSSESLPSNDSHHGISAGVGKNNNGKSDKYMDEKGLKEP